MCEILEEMRDEAMRQGMQQGMLESVRSLMETVGWTAQQALDRLKVPKSEQAKYLAML